MTDSQGSEMDVQVDDVLKLIEDFSRLPILHPCCCRYYYCVLMPYLVSFSSHLLKLAAVH